jgi:hypothetical protein
MSLTPRNWQTFQHYKDRAPPWIKLHRTLLDNADYQLLPVASRALAPMLWLLAAEYEGGVITMEFEKIAWRLRMSLDDFTSALKPLCERDFFDASEPLAPCKQSAMPEREEEAEEEGEKETDSRSVKDRPRAPSRFDEFWQAYPRRDGPNPRKPAETKFNALVKTGLDPQMLIDAAKKLASDEAARGNIGTRFIPQSVTWLNQQRWSDHAALAVLQSIADPQAMEKHLEDAVKMFAKGGFWSRHAGPAPGLIGCRASVELLAKYGIAPDGRKLPPAEAA